MSKPTLEERFWSKVEIKTDGECWPWKGAHDLRGYGQIYFNGRKMRATRVSLFLKNGVWPDPNLDACHSCDNPPCVNPAHLWLGTAKENAIDAMKKGLMTTDHLAPWWGWHGRKTHCHKGHLFSEDNVRRTKRGRICLQCYYEYNIAYNTRRRERAALANATPSGAEPTYAAQVRNAVDDNQLPADSCALAGGSSANMSNPKSAENPAGHHGMA